MSFYLAPYIVDFDYEGPFFRPRGSDQPGWSAIDIRPDPTILDGFCLLFLPVHDPDPQLDRIAAGKREVLLPNNRNRIKSKLGLVDIRATALDAIIAELLISPPPGKWKPLRASNNKRELQVWLGPRGDKLLWRSPTIRGGAVHTESFNKADSDVLGPDLTWTEGAGDHDVVGNKAKSTAVNNTAQARADADADTDDMYCQADVRVDSGGVHGGVLCRYTSAAATRTYYRAKFNVNAPLRELRKYVSGTGTNLATDATLEIAGVTITMRVEADGSTIKYIRSGVDIFTETDTAITGNTRGGLDSWDDGSFYDLFEVGDLAVGRVMEYRVPSFA